MESVKKGKTFIFAGNGSYFNRGCEAITRGTVRILRRYFDEPGFIAVSSYKNRRQFVEQSSGETDPSIIHRKMVQIYNRFDPMWFTIQALRVIRPGLIKHIMFREMKPFIDGADAVLSLGGDNYSIYYNKTARNYVYLNNLVLDHGKPMIIWGASIGPFSRYPSYEKFIIEHLRKVHIFARETSTVKYLAEQGLEDNVHLVADPAYVMEPEEPEGNRRPVIADDSIGLNLSPLMARFVTGGDLNEWRRMVGQIIESFLDVTDCHIYLIPHVTGTPSNDDYIFMKSVLQSLTRADIERVELIGPDFNSAETKWIISRMNLFAGARTHSTIAALSSSVPTISFAYSMKARGINMDVYDHLDYCIAPEKISVDLVADRLGMLVRQKDYVRDHLRDRIPVMQERAFEAGAILERII